MTKELMQLGEKNRAGRVLSEYLRGIASEKTELIRDPDSGKTKIVSKGEALARAIWEKAMGLEWDEQDGKYYCQGINLSWVKLLLERVEGKPGVNAEEMEQRQSIADRLSESNKERLNAIAGDE